MYMANRHSGCLRMALAWGGLLLLLGSGRGLAAEIRLFSFTTSKRTRPPA